MFNQYIEITDENKDILFVNTLIENIKYALISLDEMFSKNITSAFDYNEYTFYFYHMQNVLTAQGVISDILYNDYFQRREVSKNRVLRLRNKFGIEVRDFPLVGDKRFRNVNMHIDDCYDDINGGDYNIINKKTNQYMKFEILTTQHFRTIDVDNWLYFTCDKRGKRMSLNLIELKNQMQNLLNALYNTDIVQQFSTNIIPYTEIIK